MKLIRGTDKGFFAVANDTARHISHCLSNKERWFIEWQKETLYYDPARGDNVWEYFFRQQYVFEEPRQTVQDYIDLVFLKDSFRSTMNYIYTNFFILNDETEGMLIPHYKFFNEKKVLGVHIRRTDKFLVGMYGTTRRHTPVDLELFTKEIDQVIDGYDSIYLATDCSDAVAFIKNRYGRRAIYNQNAIRGNNTHSIHNNFKNLSGYVKGLNVLADAVFLSKCRHLIRSSSNVSVTSLYLNPTLSQLNLNEKYLSDSERDIL